MHCYVSRFRDLTIVLALAPAAVPFTCAAEPTTTRKCPTAELPSPHGPQVANVEALGDDSWLHLGPPAPDPTWGSARGRASWICLK